MTTSEPMSTVDGSRVDRALTGFYTVVALVALAGQAGAAVRWLGWPMAFAVAAVAAVEFGGIALSAYADHRRRLGERAVSARLLSALVAAGAVAVNWLGHTHRLQAGFFAGMSALGYLVWLLHSGARRRDQLRAEGKLPPVAPVYGVTQWLRHPGLTRSARALALADPGLGLYGSLHAACTAERLQRRQSAIAKALRRKLTEAVDPLTAEIATATFDLDEIAARLARDADYDGLTALIAVDLTPQRLTSTAGGQGHGGDVNAETDALIKADAWADSGPDSPAQTARTLTRTTQRTPARARRTTGSDTATAIARLRDRHPDMSAADIARRLGVTDRTVRRHLSAIPESPAAPAAA